MDKLELISFIQLGSKSHVRNGKRLLLAVFASASSKDDFVSPPDSSSSAASRCFVQEVMQHQQQAHPDAHLIPHAVPNTKTGGKLLGPSKRNLPVYLCNAHGILREREYLCL